MQFSPDRRRVLALGAAAGAMMAAGAILPRPARAAVKQVSLDECLAMSPQDMADKSDYVVHSWDYLRKIAATIQNPDLRSKTQAILENPNPGLLSRLDDKARKDVFDELTAKGLLKDAKPETFLPPAKNPKETLQPFRSAPGSGFQSHHSYPGGLATHTGGNVFISLAIVDAYKDAYGIELDRDVVLASQLLHDLHKPWVFQWETSGASRTEQTLAGTGEHHVLGVAESIARGLPARVVVAQACAHNHPGAEKDEAEVVGWLTAAAILAGVDPVKTGLLAQDGKTLPTPRGMEGFITHLGDHDWVLTVPAAKWTIAAMREVAAANYKLSGDDLKGPKFNALRNYAFSQATVEALYHDYSTKGMDGLKAAVANVVKPA